MKTMLYCSAAAMCLAAAKDDGGKATAANPVQQARETISPMEPGLSPPNPPIIADPTRSAHTDLAAANSEIDGLREELAKARASAESEAAGLRAVANAEKDAHDTLKAKIAGGSLSTTEAGLAEAALGGDDSEADLVEIRVKTPMLVNPSPPHWYDAARDGMLPAAYPLVKGLNLAPRWVANMAFVRANFEDDFSLDA